ncbi:MAG: NAD(P)-dependent oxidoreductase [Candidatus Neomarinimicrobiota bacterium]|nr:NAD(P)-dependent oxidoreductase [Candidatus Neomarinimicrobiota bacterium]
MGSFKNKTVLITGGSRGIGKAIGLRLAREGANIVIAAKTVEPHPKLPGTIYTAAEEMEAAGGKGFGVCTDIRFEEQVQSAVDTTADKFGGIDILINNASAIQLTNTMDTQMKRYDLMHQVNVRGTFLASKLCIPHLENAENPHILNISPPLNLETKWFAPHVAYTMSKFGMSMCVLGMAGELKKKGIAVNALWPKTTIQTAAIQNLLGGDELMNKSRKPDIMADAAFTIFSRDSQLCTGNYFVDEEVLRSEGVTDLSKYANVPEAELAPDFFV